MATHSNHVAPCYSVQPTLSPAHNQPSQLVQQGSRSSDSADVTGLGTDGLEVSGIGRLYSPYYEIEKIDSQVGGRSRSSPKPSKKRSSYYTRRSNEKKERLIWSEELHQCFLEIYNRLPIEKRVPKKITEEMKKKYPNIVTRENVASHLQKHRLNLKGKEKKKENSAKPSSKSVLPKVTKQEINFPKFYNDTSNSTCPNAAQILHQSHFNSTNPNSQSHSLSTNIPTTQLSLHGTMVNPLFYHYEPTDLSDSNMVRVLDNGLNTDLSVPENASIYLSRLNILDRPEINYPFGVIGQSSNEAYSYSDFPVMVNPFPPPTPTNHPLITNFDGYDNAFNPIMGNSNVGGFSDNNYYFGAPSNSFDDHMNYNLDHNVLVDGLNNMYPLGSNSDANLQFSCPFNSNVADDLQMIDLEQFLQFMFNPPDHNLVDNASRLPQNIENMWKNDSKSTSTNESFSSRGCSSNRIMR